MHSPRFGLLVTALSIFGTSICASANTDAIFEHRQATTNRNLILPSSALKQPTTPLRLITLGVGTQNYTCPSETGSPFALGSLATLYNFTALVAQSPSTAHSYVTAVVKLPALAEKFQQVGQHCYNQPSQPVFDMPVAGLRLYATKSGSVAAPTATDISWQLFSDDGSKRSKGIGSAYRVETANGQPPATCTGQSVEETSRWRMLPSIGSTHESTS